MLQLFLVLLSICDIVTAGTIIASTTDRDTYITNAITWFPDKEAKISTRDMLNGPKNPYKLETFQELDCNFVEPSVADPLGGTTPKFKCEFEFEGEMVQVKIKYDQQYNTAHTWGRGNPEVYTSIVSQRILWSLGFGADQSIPVIVNCNNCPLEPWTYIQQIQGYSEEDIASGWLDIPLIKSGKWNTTVPKSTFAGSIVYLKLDNYEDGDEIDYLDVNGNEQRGFVWSELYTKPTSDETQTVARDALTIIAAFLSYCDNFDGNQGFICLDSDNYMNTNTNTKKRMLKDKTECKGTPLMYIHDAGGTLGYGWNLKHKNFWPNYMDLKQVLSVTVYVFKV